MKRWTLILVVAMTAVAEDANLQSGVFAGRAWSLQTPHGYVVANTAQPNEQSRMIGFAPEPRADGTRPMMQVTLIDISKAGESADFLERAGAVMIGGIERRREEWKVAESKTKVGDVSAIRYDWSGISIPAADGAAIRARMRGVMIVGIDRGVAFTLHTQDVDEHAEETFRRTEPAMATFRFNPR